MRIEPEQDFDLCSSDSDESSIDEQNKCIATAISEENLRAMIGLFKKVYENRRHEKVHEKTLYITNAMELHALN